MSEIETEELKGAVEEAMLPYFANGKAFRECRDRILAAITAWNTRPTPDGVPVPEGGEKRCAHCVAVDGPHPPGDQRFWLARKLMDSKLTDDEAFGVVAYHPSISDQYKPTPPVTPQVGAGDADAQVEGALGSLPPIALHEALQLSEWSGERPWEDPEWCAKWNAVGNEQRPFLVMVQALRADEGDSITLLCDNPEGPPNNAIECCGAWTDWVDRRFEGETLRAAVLAAYDARRTYQQASMGGSELKTAPPQVEGAGR